MNVRDMRLLCNSAMPGVIILQGKIISTSERTKSQLISDIQSMAYDRINMTLFNQNLMALDNCSCCVHLTELGVEPAADNCVGRGKNHKQGLSKDGKIGIGVSVPIVLLTSLLVSIIVYKYMYILRRRR